MHLTLDFWWGVLAGLIAMAITGFVLCTLIVALLFRYRWAPNAIAEPRTWTGDT